MHSFGYTMLQGGSQAIDPDAATHIARLTSTDLNLERALNTLILSLKNTGVWAKLDDLCVIHKNLADSLLGLKGTQDSSEIKAGTPSITYASSTGVGTENIDASNYAYIDTGLNDTTGNLTTDDMTAFAFMTAETGGIASGDFMGAWETAPTDSILLRSDDGTPFTALHAGTNGGAAVDVTVAAGNIGFIGGTRTASNAVEVRFNGSNATNTTASVGGGPTNNILVGSYNLNGTPYSLTAGTTDFSAWGAGGGLTSQELSDLRDAIQAYMTARGV